MEAIIINVDCVGIEANRKKQLLQELSSLEVPLLEKLVALKKSKTAIDYLKNKWSTVKIFLKV